MAGVLNLFAPSSTDKEYISQLIKEITPKKCHDNCAGIHQLLQTSTEISRKDLLPLIEKGINFINDKNDECANDIFSLILPEKFNIFRSSDLTNLFSSILNNLSSSVLPTILEICGRTLNTIDDLRNLVDDSLKIVPLASIASHPQIISFVIKVSQLDPSLRVPFVFAGLIEQIIPTIQTEKSHTQLLASLLCDPKSRQYFIQMGHIPKIIPLLFESEISNPATYVFRSLFSKMDLLNLPNLQQSIQTFDLTRQLALKMTQADISETTARNSILCIADSIRFCHLTSCPFAFQSIIDLFTARPTLRNAVLYLAETLEESNPHLIPLDETFLFQSSIKSDLFFALFMSFLSYDANRKSALDLSQYSITTIQSNSPSILPILLVVSIQRHILLDGVELLAQNPENEIIQALSCINCFICHSYPLPKSSLLHYGRKLFSNRQSIPLNPLDSLFSDIPFDTNVKKLDGFDIFENTFLPKIFVEVYESMFSEINIGKLLNDTKTFSTIQPFEIFDVNPEKSHQQLLEINRRANDIMKENIRWKAKFEALDAEHTKLVKDYSHIEMELIESKCQQLALMKPENN